MRDCLIVVGMHRSGTSALAGALHQLGVDFGTNLVEAQDDNVRGYYEHRRILELHESLLAAHGSGWDDPAAHDWALDAGSAAAAAFREELETVLEESFADSDLWAVKDPRLSHLLPLWLPVLEGVGAKPRIVVASRSPVEIAASLARRDGFSREKSGLLWLQHTLAAERSSRPFPRAFVDYADLLRDAGAALDRVGRQLGLRWPVQPTAAAAKLGTFLDPNLRHQRADKGAPAASWGRLGELVPSLVEALRRAVDAPADSEPFETIAARLATTTSGVDSLVLEHLHQFGRREVLREVWSTSQALQKRLADASERLGAGLGQTERQLEALAGHLDSIEAELDRRSSVEADGRAEIDRTLDHLTEGLAAAERGVSHLESQEADLRAKIARWSDEVDIEDRLTTLEAAVARWSGDVDVEGQLARLGEKLSAADTALAFLAERTAGLDTRVSAVESGWWQRLVRGLRRLLRRS